MNLRRWVAALLCGFVLVSGVPARAQQPADPVAITLPSGALEEYVGQYREPSEPEVVDSVYREDGKLYVEGPRMARGELRAESVDHFFEPGSEVRVVFARDGSGKISTLTMTFGEG